MVSPNTVENPSLDTRAATIVLGPDHADFPLTEAGLLAAIALLPAAGGEIFLREGTLSLSASPPLTNKPISVIGSGRGSTIIDLGANAIAAFTMPFDRPYRFKSFTVLGDGVTAGQMVLDHTLAGVAAANPIIIEDVQTGGISPAGSQVNTVLRVNATGNVTALFTDCHFQFAVAGTKWLWSTGPGRAVFTRVKATPNFSIVGGVVFECAACVFEGATITATATGAVCSGSHFSDGSLTLGSDARSTGCKFSGSQTVVSAGNDAAFAACDFLAAVATALSITGIKNTVAGCAFENYVTQALSISATDSVVTGNRNCKVTETGGADANSYANNTGFYPGSTIIGPLSTVDGQQTRKTTTTPYTVVVTDRTLLIDATAGNKTVTLPTAATSKWRILTVKKIDSSGNTVTIDGNGAETIDGALTKVIEFQYNSFTVQSDGTEWWVL